MPLVIASRRRSNRLFRYFYPIRTTEHRQHRTSVRQLSLALPGGSISAPPPVTLPSNHRVGAFVSRRLWKKLYEAPPRKSSTATTGSDDSEKPWPRSLQILGYGLASTVVAYCLAWYIATNVTIRNALEPLIPGMMPVLRRCFGEPEEDFISYVDQREDQGNFIVPISLGSEPKTSRRREQEALEGLTKDTSLIPTRLWVYTHGGFNLGQVVDLPGNELVTRESLLGVLMGERNQSVDPDTVSCVTVAFGSADVEPTDTGTRNDWKDYDDVNSPVTASGTASSGSTLMAMDGSNTSSASTTDGSNLELSSHLLRLTRMVGTFSLWYYHPALSSSASAPSGTDSSSNSISRKNGGSTTTARMNQNDMKEAALQYEIDRLQAQLEDRSTMRDLDDITQELKQAKSELRSLRWKKRLRVFG